MAAAGAAVSRACKSAGAGVCCERHVEFAGAVASRPQESDVCVANMTVVAGDADGVKACSEPQRDRCWCSGARCAQVRQACFHYDMAGTGHVDVELEHVVGAKVTAAGTQAVDERSLAVIQMLVIASERHGWAC